MRRVALVTLLAVIPSACVSVSTFQLPEPVDRGKTVLGVGATTMLSDGAVGLIPELYGRYGIAHDWDIGLKFVGFPPVGFFQADVKRLLVDGDYKLAADLGISRVGGEVTVTTTSGDGDTEEYKSDWGFTALYPALIVGKGSFHGGVKAIIIGAGTSEDDFITDNVVGLFAGTRLGGRVQWVPEVHVYFGAGGTLVTGGLGVQFPLGGN